jgi:hypothetical protein
MERCMRGFRAVVTRLTVVLLGAAILTATAVNPSHAAATGPQAAAGTCVETRKVVNVRNIGTMTTYPSGLGWEVVGQNGNTISLNHAVGFSNSYSASASITAGAVTIGVGFDVTRSFSASTQASFTVPAGQKWLLYAYLEYVWYDFQIRVTNSCTGSWIGGHGDAYKYWRIGYNQIRIG